jgi:hypothetical protein
LRVLDRDRCFACAALLMQPFALYLIVLRWLAPPTAANWAHADPFLRLLPARIAPALGIAVAAAWLWRAPPERALLGRAAGRALLGAALALLAVGGLRLFAGAHLPSFVPAEESAGPGLLLSMSAGFNEEQAFRLLLLPALLALLSRGMSRRAATVLAVVATGAAFALAHGPAPATWMATRFLIPGCLFSAVCLWLGPGFAVSAHLSAHLLLPLLFAQ